jgi:hypothetical protein
MLMFTEITWGTYLRLVAALLFIYYLLLILKCYFPQIRASLSQGTGPGILYRQDAMMEENATDQEKGNLTSTGYFTASQGGNDYEIIEEIVERVKAVLHHAADTTMDIPEVSSSLAKILSDYPALARSTFRPSINEFIATESELHGFLALNQDAVEQLWPIP